MTYLGDIGAAAQAGAPDSRVSHADAEWRRFAAASTAEEFCEAWLALQCELIGDVVHGVVVLQLVEDGPFVPAAFWPNAGRRHPALATVVESAVRDGVGVVEWQGSVRGLPAELMAAFPVTVGGRVRAVAAMVFKPRAEARLEVATRQIQWGSGWLEALLRRTESSREVVGRERLNRALEVLAAGLQREGARSAALACATELATLLGCDRVSLALTRRGRARLHALSHNAEFDTHANLVRAMEAAMDEALDQNETVLHPQHADARRPLVTHAHERLARESGADTLLTVLMKHGDRAVGALTFERAGEARFEPAVIEFCESAGALMAPLFELQVQAERGALGRARASAAGAWRRLVGPAHAGLKLAAVVMLSIAAFLAFATRTFHVPAKAAIEGEVRRVITAPFNGYMKEGLARPGDRLAAGAALARLDDRDLKLERSKSESQHDQLLKQHREALADSDRAQNRILSAQIQQVEAQLALIDEQLARTAITSPLDGIVVAGDLSQRVGAPVERGETLFEIAPLDRYRVVLKVEEHDIEHVRLGATGRLTLTSLPGEEFPFTVTRITPVTIAEDGQNHFRVEARLDDGAERLRPGMEGVGKVAADEHRFVWIWTRNFIDWLRLRLWAWLA